MTTEGVGWAQIRTEHEHHAALRGSVHIIQLGTNLEENLRSPVKSVRTRIHCGQNKSDGLITHMKDVLQR